MKKLFYGGKVLTMAEPMYAEAVLVEKGMILALGTEERLRGIAQDYEEIDLHGATLMPGFIDAHSHFFQVATSMLQLSISGASSTEEIAFKVQEFISSSGIQPGQWVNVRDYDNNLMPDLKNPTLAQLNAFAPNNPLVIYHKSGHMGLMNSAALERLGITADTPSPDGGRIEVIDGVLTGYLEENAFIESIKKIPLPGVADLVNAFVLAQDKYASYGITTIQDGMVVQEMLPLYQMLIQKNLLKLDVMLYPSLQAYDAAVQMLHNIPPQTYVHVGGAKIFLDGSPQGRTAWMREPYEGDDNYCGYGTLTDDAVIASFEQAAQLGAQLIGHCNGDMAAEQFLRCLEVAEKKYPQLQELRPVIIHGQLIGRDQLSRVQQLGAMISFFVAHVYHWGDVHLRNFGEDRAAHISPTHSALDSGVLFTFHQDAPVIEPDMLETVWCAVNRQTKEGIHLGPDEQISTLDALRAITVNGAYQYFQEEAKGSIAPGKQADFVVLDADPLEMENSKIKDIRVLKTYKSGECIYTRS